MWIVGGAVVAVLVVLALIAAIAYKIIKRRRLTSAVANELPMNEMPNGNSTTSDPEYDYVYEIEPRNDYVNDGPGNRSNDTEQVQSMYVPLVESPKGLVPIRHSTKGLLKLIT